MRVFNSFHYSAQQSDPFFLVQSAFFDKAKYTKHLSTVSNYVIIWRTSSMRSSKQTDIHTVQITPKHHEWITYIIQCYLDGGTMYFIKKLLFIHCLHIKSVSWFFLQSTLKFTSCSFINVTLYASLHGTMKVSRKYSPAVASRAATIHR